MAELPGVFRVKVYDREGRIVWSDEPRLVGRVFPDNAYLSRALMGEVTLAIRVPREAEHLYERPWGYVAETYVPIVLPRHVGLVGVIEAYQDVTVGMLDLHRTQRRIWGFVGGAGLLLYVALALVVRNAWANERCAIHRLEARNRELTRLQHSTRDAHERLAAILSGVADRMVIVDREMRVVWLNAAAAEAVGTGRTAVGRPCYEVFDAQREACEGCPVTRAFVSGRVERGIRKRRLPDGALEYLDLVSAPLHDATDGVHQVLEVARDITGLEKSNAELRAKTVELERTNQALREAQAQLVAKERLAAVGEVAVSLHHAILNPLTGLLGVLQALKEGLLAPAARTGALAQAEAEAHKIEQVIRQLATLDRAADTPYVGRIAMLDLDPVREGDATP
jgi:PAS domain S-box-containing protein